MKIILINDTTNWYHFGCTGTSTAIINQIKKLNHEITTVPITETYKIKSTPNTKAGFLNEKEYKRFIKDNYQLISTIEQYDILVINGEGTLHGKNQAPLSLLYLAYITKTKLHKNVQIINHSVYPTNGFSINSSQEHEIVDIYTLVYNVIDFTAIREPVSYKLMTDLGIKATESFDCLPLYIQNNYKSSFAIKPSNSELLIAGSATWLQLDILSNKSGNINEYTQSLHLFKKYLQTMSDRGFSIKFLLGAKDYPAKDELEFIKFMQDNDFKADWIVYEAKTIEDWLNTIATASLLVSGRFHHTIAAACLETPFIPLSSNTPKMTGLINALDLNDSVIKWDNNIYNNLLRTTDIQLSENIVREEKIDGVLNKLSSKAERNFEKLK